MSITSIPSKETREMDTLEAIRTRRSIRQYLDKPVPQDLLQQVLALAMYAPSACNQQPWQFVVIEDRKLLREVPIEACIANERRATNGSPDPRAFTSELPNSSCAGINKINSYAAMAVEDTDMQAMKGQQP